MGGRSGTLVGREVLGRGPELGVGWGGEDTFRPLVAFPKAPNPDRLHPVFKADQLSSRGSA